jgi:deoxyadenosine/deoxycytidine kinase
MPGGSQLMQSNMVQSTGCISHKLTEVERIISDFKAQRKRSVVFVCGYSGAGKSTFCESLAASFAGECVIFEVDWYIKFATEERWRRIQNALNSGDSERIAREENPILWIDWDSFAADFRRFQEHGNLTIRNAWNRLTKRWDYIKLSLHDRISLILCDGADLTIMLDVPFPLCNERYNVREAHRSPDEYLSYKSYRALLLERYAIPYFEKYRGDADIIIDNSGADWEIVKCSLQEQSRLCCSE